MQLLLEDRGAGVVITEEVVKAAAGNWGNGKDAMQLLLEYRRACSLRKLPERFSLGKLSVKWSIPSDSAGSRQSSLERSQSKRLSTVWSKPLQSYWTDSGRISLTSKPISSLSTWGRTPLQTTTSTEQKANSSKPARWPRPSALRRSPSPGLTSSVDETHLRPPSVRWWQH